MRLIDADELIKHFKEFHEYYTEDNLKFDEDEIYSVIGEQPTVSEWISVKDELPEDVQETVLVYVDMGHGFGYMETAHYLRDKKEWLTPRQETIEDSRCKVTHWMPMPEPPEE